MKPTPSLSALMQSESLSSILLLIMAIAGVLLANSPLTEPYSQFVTTFLITINDGLMALFFLLIGLELKREFKDGHLSQGKVVLLPALAAFGGMLMPALIYIAINHQSPGTLQGWAIPVATDIAFALAVLTLFGKKVPRALKLFLLTIAIFDDLGAIIIIALFYSHGLNSFALLCAFLAFTMLLVMNRVGVKTLWPYLLLGAGLWLGFFCGGIHPTLAGVLLALTIPDQKANPGTPLRRLETNLQPCVAYFILPLFALANAGFTWPQGQFEFFYSKIVLGTVLGLVIGKQLGVFLLTWICVKLRFSSLPKGCSWVMIYGIALICGIGFTMSLFLGTLSFPNENSYLTEVRLGVFIGSIVSGLAGALILRRAFSTN